MIRLSLQAVSHDAALCVRPLLIGAEVRSIYWSDAHSMKLTVCNLSHIPERFSFRRSGLQIASRPADCLPYNLQLPSLSLQNSVNLSMLMICVILSISAMRVL